MKAINVCMMYDKCKYDILLKLFVFLRTIAVGPQLTDVKGEKVEEG
jgi:hypothetical protein